MALIADETILEVKRSVDITEIISGYIPLKRAGSSYKALCPFHEEKSPSFIVTPTRQTFKCFGCGKGGDAINFVMAHENVDYPEAEPAPKDAPKDKEKKDAPPAKPGSLLQMVVKLTTPAAELRKVLGGE